MIDIPLNASVECTDGPCGQSVTIIVNPTTQKVTHLVVEDKHLLHADQRLVPIEQVAETTPEVIRLRCTKADLAEMESFVETQYIKNEGPALAYEVYQGGAITPPDYYFSAPYVTPTEIPVEVERVPPGELAVRRGTRVKATDGYVGQVGELLVDENEHVSHFTLQAGHLWGKKDIMLPVSAVKQVLEDTVYLNLDKQAIDQLPAVPVKRNYILRHPDPTSIELFAFVFDQPGDADEALELLEVLHRRKTIQIRNAAVLVKDEDGQASIRDVKDLDPGTSRLAGAVVGGLAGLLVGPVGAVVGALAGAGVGDVAAQKVHRGFSRAFLNNLRERLQPGYSALIVVVEHQWAFKLNEVLADEEGVVLHQTITDKLVEDLLAESEA